MTSVVDVMAQQFGNLGIRTGGVVLVHSSLRSLGPIDGGAETVVLALLRALGEGGTLLLPALSYESVTRQNPYFDLRSTPACVGALAEYFRLRAGTRRSMHPTHSVCGVGARIDGLLQDHEVDTTPCGENSPFRRLPLYNGQILFIGCGLRPNTSMHAIEELTAPPYLFGDELDYALTDEAGRVLKRRHRRHSFRGWEQRYDRVTQVLDGDALRTGRVLDADCHLLEATTLWAAVHETLEEHPYFFVDWHGDPLS